MAAGGELGSVVENNDQEVKITVLPSRLDT